MWERESAAAVGLHSLMGMVVLLGLLALGTLDGAMDGTYVVHSVAHM